MKNLVKNENYKITFKYLKDKFNLRKFLNTLNKEIKIGTSNRRHSYDTFRWQSTSNILLNTYKNVRTFASKSDDHIGYERGDEITMDFCGQVYNDDKLSLKIFLLEREGRFLTTLTKNFNKIDAIYLDLKSEINLIYCLFSKLDKSFYLFVNNEPKKVGASKEFAFFVTKKKVIAINKMKKITDLILKKGAFKEEIINRAVKTR